MWDSMAANILHGDPDGAEILIVTGSADTLARPDEVSCIVDHLGTDAVVPTVCVDGSTHFDVVPRGGAFVLSYASAIVDGTAPPACPAAGTLPACR